MYTRESAQKPSSSPFSLHQISPFTLEAQNAEMHSLSQPPVHTGSGEVAQSWPTGAEKSVREDSSETECPPA